MHFQPFLLINGVSLLRRPALARTFRLDNINYMLPEFVSAVNLAKFRFKKLRISQKPTNWLANNEHVLEQDKCSPRFPGLGPYRHAFESLTPLLLVVLQDLSDKHAHGQGGKVLAQYSV